MKKYFILFLFSLLFGFTVLILRNLYEEKSGEMKSYWNVQQIAEGDSKNFFDRGLALSEGKHYFTGYENVPVIAFFRPPAYPIFIAFVFKIFGVSLKPIIVLQIIMTSIIICLISLISNLIFKDKIISRISGILAILYYPMWNDAMIINSELLSMLLGLLALFFILKFYFANEVNIKNLLLSGLFAGLASLTRGQFFFYSLLFLIFIYSLKNISFLNKSKFVLYWLGITLVPVILWSLYAYLSTGILLFISTQGPYSIWWGWSPQVVYEENYPMWNSLWNIDFLQGDLIGLYLPVKSSSWFLNEAINFIFKYPYDCLKIGYFKLLDSWGFIDLYSRNTIFSKIIKLIKLNWDFFLAIPGFYLIWKNKNKTFLWYSISAILIYTAISIMTAGLIRYRIPFLDPILILFASLTVYKIYIHFTLKFKIQKV